jgi:DNA-binding NarL/FixJ family response regulator
MNVLIVDDHPLVHEVLGAVVRFAFGKITIRTATNVDDAIAVARELPKLGLVLLDLGLPGCSGVEALSRFRANFPDVTTVVVSADSSRASIRAAVTAGAVGYLPKTLSPKVMAAALKVVAAGGSYFPFEALVSGVSADLNDNKAAHSRAADLVLTNRQIEILRLIVKGYQNRSIAHELSISEGTVKQHVHNMFCALRVSSRTEAVAFASLYGIVGHWAEHRGQP